MNRKDQSAEGQGWGDSNRERSMRIMVVDDDPLFVDILRSSLVAMGFEDPVCDFSAEAALKRLKTEQEPVGTFLLDIHLPEKDGIDLCAELRQMPAYRMTPIIMLTASKNPDAMGRAFAAGATDFVSKPLDSLELGTRIKIAGMLNESMDRERKVQQTLEDLTELTRVKFDEKIKLRQSDVVVEYLALENTLLKAGGRCYAMSIFSIKMGSARNIFDSVSPPAFVRHLDRIAESLSLVLTGENTNVAYVGNGIFIGVKHGRRRLDLAAVGQEVREVLERNWDAESLERASPPRLRFTQVSDKGVWTLLSATEAIQSASELTEPETGIDERDEAELFHRMEDRLNRIGRSDT